MCIEIWQLSKILFKKGSLSWPIHQLTSKWLLCRSLGKSSNESMIAVSCVNAVVVWEMNP
jgi:hypothetical protein